MSCEIILTSCLAVAFPSVAWREDILIPTPQLVYPYTDRTFCLDVINTNDSQICLIWEPIAEADTFLLQWSLNPAFNGPSVQEQIVPATTNPLQYCLRVPQDIRQGADIYWRVIAANLANGGVSNKSETRKIIYNCGENQNTDIANRCDQYNITPTIHGPQSMKCCDYSDFAVEIPYVCKDFNDNQIIEVDENNVTWSVSIDGDDSASVESNSANRFVTGIRTCSTETRLMQVCADIPFRDNIRGDTFNCNACKKVFVDCGNPDEADCSVVKIPSEYHAEGDINIKEVGTRVSQDCGCGGDCKFFSNYRENPAAPNKDMVEAFNISSYYSEPCGFEFQFRLIVQGGEPDTTFEITEIGNSSPQITLTNFTGTTSVPVSIPYRIDYSGDDLSYYIRYEAGCIDPGDFLNGTKGIGLRVTDINDPDQSYDIGFRTVCQPAQCDVEKYFFTGPVYQVIKSDNTLWPDCRTSDQNDLCTCEYGGLEYRGCVLKIGEPVELSVPCCDDCANPSGTIELVSSTIDDMDDCEDITHEVKIDISCDGVAKPSTTESIMVDCTMAGMPTDIAVTACSEDFVVTVTPIASAVTADTTVVAPMKPCTDVVIDNGELCFEWRGITRCINVEYDNGVWEITSGREFTILNSTFYVQNLYFENGCELYIDLCWSLSPDCGTCGPALCDCGGGGFGATVGCRYAKRQQMGNVLISSGALNQNTDVMFTLNCNDNRYVSDSVVFSDTNGCVIRGRFFIETSGVFFRGTDIKNDAITVQLSTQQFFCPLTRYDIGANGVVTCRNPSSGQFNTQNVFFRTDVTFDSDDCECARGAIELTVAECMPLQATGTLEVDDETLNVTLQGDGEGADCSCPTDNTCKPLEARVNIALGCGLHVDNNAIKLDYDKVLGTDDDFGYFKTIFPEDTTENCPIIVPPICECVNDAHIYKNSIHCGTTAADIPAGEDGPVDLTEPPFNGGQITAQNKGTEDIPAGEPVIVLVTNNCQPVVIAITCGEGEMDCCPFDDICCTMTAMDTGIMVSKGTPVYNPNGTTTIEITFECDGVVIGPIPYTFGCDEIECNDPEEITIGNCTGTFLIGNDPSCCIIEDCSTAVLEFCNINGIATERIGGVDNGDGTATITYEFTCPGPNEGDDPYMQTEDFTFSCLDGAHECREIELTGCTPPRVIAASFDFEDLCCTCLTDGQNNVDSHMSGNINLSSDQSYSGLALAPKFSTWNRFVVDITFISSTWGGAPPANRGQQRLSTSLGFIAGPISTTTGNSQWEHNESGAMGDIRSEVGVVGMHNLTPGDIITYEIVRTDPTKQDADGLADYVYNIYINGNPVYTVDVGGAGFDAWEDMCLVTPRFDWFRDSFHTDRGAPAVFTQNSRFEYAP